MKLAILFEVGSMYAGSYTATLPVEYESAEQFLVDYEKYCKENQRIAGRYPNGKPDDFIPMLDETHLDTIKVQTIDEWFSSGGEY